MYKKVFVSGQFNVMHPGHLRILSYARSLGERLIVGVLSDELTGFSAYVPEMMRLDVVKTNNLVDESFLITTSITDVINELKPDAVVKGKEYESRENEEVVILNSYGGKLIFSSGELALSSLDMIHQEFNKGESKKFFLPDDYLSRHSISREKLVETVKSFSQLNVIVIGDLIVDEYITCLPLGMSQEDPTLVVTPLDSVKFLGGAGIVAAHSKGLGANVRFISVVGDDQVADYAKSCLEEVQVDSTLLVDQDRPTSLKQRYRCKGKSLLRVSHLHQGSISKKLQDEILILTNSFLKTADLVVFSDFNYGVLPAELVKNIILEAKSKGAMIVADSQSSSQIGDLGKFQNVDLITPTEREARICVKSKEDGLVVLAEKLLHTTNAKNLILKLSEEGVIVYSGAPNDWLTDEIPALNKNPKDVSGAGDSLLITSSMTLASGGSLWEAGLIGSIAAAVQVSRIGNVPLTIDELTQKIFE
jgi:rfaE bifunctional protein kinase chain/domain